jgi:hypothetical protein
MARYVGRVEKLALRDLQNPVELTVSEVSPTTGELRGDVSKERVTTLGRERLAGVEQHLKLVVEASAGRIGGLRAGVKAARKLLEETKSISWRTIWETRPNKEKRTLTNFGKGAFRHKARPSWPRPGRGAIAGTLTRWGIV